MIDATDGGSQSKSWLCRSPYVRSCRLITIDTIDVGVFESKSVSIDWLSIVSVSKIMPIDNDQYDRLGLLRARVDNVVQLIVGRLIMIDTIDRDDQSKRWLCRKLTDW